MKRLLAIAALALHTLAAAQPALLTDALDLEWYAAGGGISRSGPYATQADAWEAMRYADDVRAKERCEHPRDTRVWPERVRG